MDLGVETAVFGRRDNLVIEIGVSHTPGRQSGAHHSQTTFATERENNL